VERGLGGQPPPDIVKLAHLSVLVCDCGVFFVLFESSPLVFFYCGAFDCALLSMYDLLFCLLGLAYQQEPW